MPSSPVDRDGGRPRASPDPFLDVGGRTDRGRVQPSNTDFFLTADLHRSLVLGPSSLQIAEGDTWARARQGKLLIIADGIPSDELGEIASWITVDVIARYITEVSSWSREPSPRDDDRLAREVERALLAGQTRVRRQADRSREREEPVGSTMTMAYVVWPHLQILHVGSGRAYVHRDRRLLQLTTDGAAPPIDDHTIGVEHRRFHLEPGDQILLCTDGLTRHLIDDEIQRELERGATAATACRRLVERANRRGGHDNITAVIARTG